MSRTSSEEMTFDEYINSQQLGIWIDASFDFNQSLKRADGPILEVGGPTAKGYQMIGRRVLRGTIVSNISPRDSLDVIADAHHLPFENKTFAAVLSSAFSDHSFFDDQGNDIGYRAPMIDEAVRVVKNGGVVVLQHGNMRNIKRLSQHGLNPVTAKVNKAKYPRRRLTTQEDEDNNVFWSHTKSLFVYQKTS